MSLSGGAEKSNGLESNIEYDMNALGDVENAKYYEWDAQKHTTFPAMNTDHDHLPIGDSVGMCLGLSWIEIKKRN